jgi:hypothetical protein
MIAPAAVGCKRRLASFVEAAVLSTVLIQP